MIRRAVTSPIWNGLLSEKGTTRTVCAWAADANAGMTNHSRGLIRVEVRPDYDITDAMRRRTLLQAPLLAGMARAKPSGFKLSVRVEPLFPELPLAAQVEKVA